MPTWGISPSFRLKVARISQRRSRSGAGLTENPGPAARPPSQGISRMQAEAYGRARKLLTSHRAFVVARVLGFVQSLLLVALLGVIALFVAVMASRGEARFPSAMVPKLAPMVAS